MLSDFALSVIGFFTESAEPLCLRRPVASTVLSQKSFFLKSVCLKRKKNDMKIISVIKSIASCLAVCFIYGLLGLFDTTRANLGLGLASASSRYDFHLSSRLQFLESKQRMERWWVTISEMHVWMCRSVSMVGLFQRNFSFFKEENAKRKRKLDFKIL